MANQKLSEISQAALYDDTEFYVQRAGVTGKTDLSSLSDAVSARLGFDPSDPSIVNYENLNANGDVGQIASTVAAGNDVRFPTNDEKAAFSGGGVPTVSNYMILNDDERIQHVTSGQFMNASELMVVRDVKSQGTAGQTLTAGGNIRDLNQLYVDNIGEASFADNRVSLPPGSYIIEAKSKFRTDPGSGVTPGKTVLYLYNETADTNHDHVTAYLAGYSTAGTMDEWLHLKTVVVIGVQSAFYLGANVQYNTEGGYALNVSGFDERYSEMWIWKVN